MEGKKEAEGAALAGDGGERGFAAMELGDVLDDRKTKTGTTEGAGTRLVDTIEPFEDTCLMFGRDTDAMITDFDDGAGGFLDEGNFDGPGAGILDGVVDEVGDGLFEELGIAITGDFVVADEGKDDAGGRGLGAGEGDGGGDGGIEGARGEILFGISLFAFKLGEGKDVLDKGVEAGGLLAEDGEEGGAFGGRERLGILQGLDGAEDAGEGSLDLVGDVGDEVAAEGFGAAGVLEDAGLLVAFAGDDGEAGLEVAGEEENEDDDEGTDKAGGGEATAGEADGRHGAFIGDGEADDMATDEAGTVEHELVEGGGTADNGEGAAGAGGDELLAAGMVAQGAGRGIGIGEDAAGKVDNGNTDTLGMAGGAKGGKRGLVATGEDGLEEGSGEVGLFGDVAFGGGLEGGAEAGCLGEENDEEQEETDGGGRGGNKRKLIVELHGDQARR